jgi:fructose-bisphosphate aldolase class II
MSSGAEKLKNNKSIAILDAAERGGYGVVSVVCVRVFPILSSRYFRELAKILDLKLPSGYVNSNCGN